MRLKKKPSDFDGSFSKICEMSIDDYYNDTLYDLLLIITIIMPLGATLISSCEDFVVEVVIMRPWRSMMVYLASGAVSMNMIRLNDHTLMSLPLSSTGLTGVPGSTSNSAATVTLLSGMVN